MGDREIHETESDLPQNQRYRAARVHIANRARGQDNKGTGS